MYRQHDHGVPSCPRKFGHCIVRLATTESQEDYPVCKTLLSEV